MLLVHAQLLALGMLGERRAETSRGEEELGSTAIGQMSLIAGQLYLERQILKMLIVHHSTCAASCEFVPIKSCAWVSLPIYACRF